MANCRLPCPLFLLLALRLKQRTMRMGRVPAVAKKQKSRRIHNLRRNLTQYGLLALDKYKRNLPKRKLVGSHPCRPVAYSKTPK